MKKGISLIVLVITIIVMIILAAAIIISISNSNVINKATQAVSDTNIATIKEAAALKYADVTLAIKEAGNDSILGGKTVGQYIEQELITDGTMKKSDAVIFTPKGGVYGPNEYNSIPDKDDVKEEYIKYGDQVYYVGLDIDKRIALKSNPNINTDYLYAYNYHQINYETQVVRSCTLGDLGIGDKVSIFEEISSAHFSPNIDRTGTANSNTIVSNGMMLTFKSNYNSIQVRVILPGDVLFCGFAYFQGFFDLYAEEIANGGYTYTQLRGDFEILDSVSQEEFERVFNLAADIDLDGDFDINDAHLASMVCEEVYHRLENLRLGKTLKEINGYQSLQGKEYFNVDKKIYGFPADIAK